MQCSKSDADAPSVGDVRLLSIELRSSFEHVLAESPTSTVDVDGDDLTAVLGLDEWSDVALIDFLAESGDLFIGFAGWHHSLDFPRCCLPLQAYSLS